MDERFTDLKLKGKLLQSAALRTSNGDDLVMPVKILQGQANDLGPPKPVYGCEQKNRLRSTLREIGVIERRDKTTHLLPRWTLWRGDRYWPVWCPDCFAKTVLIPATTLSVVKKTSQRVALPADRSRLPAFDFTFSQEIIQVAKRDR